MISICIFLFPFSFSSLFFNTAERKANSLTPKSREILESLINNHSSFQSLTFNLATVYELCSENSGALKVALAERVSRHPQSEHHNWELPNSHFKI